MTTLVDIKRSVRVGREYLVTSLLDAPFNGSVHATVTKAFPTRFFVAHPLGETKIYWPPARYVAVDENGVIELRGTGVNAGKPFLKLIPLEIRAGH